MRVQPGESRPISITVANTGDEVFPGGEAVYHAVDPTTAGPSVPGIPTGHHVIARVPLPTIPAGGQVEAVGTVTYPDRKTDLSAKARIFDMAGNLWLLKAPGSRHGQGPDVNIHLIGVGTGQGTTPGTVAGNKNTWEPGKSMPASVSSSAHGLFQRTAPIVFDFGMGKNVPPGTTGYGDVVYGASGRAFEIALPVPENTYKVLLDLTEAYYDKEGEREFSVSLDGQELTVFKNRPRGVANVLEFPARTLTRGSKLSFSPRKGDAFIGKVELVPEG